MIKQKVTEYTSHFLVETRLTFTKKEAEAFYLDKNLKRKINAIKTQVYVIKLKL